MNKILQFLNNKYFKASIDGLLGISLIILPESVSKTTIIIVGFIFITQGINKILE